jgi:hypothetical protein
MTRFDLRNAAGFAAAIAVTLWSAGMMFAATAIPSVSALA